MGRGVAGVAGLLLLLRDTGASGVTGGQVVTSFSWWGSCGAKRGGQWRGGIPEVTSGRGWL